MNQHEQDLLSEIHSAQTVIERCDYTGSARNAFTVGALTGMLASMAGLDEYATHPSCFSTEITQAIQNLLEAIDQQ